MFTEVQLEITDISLLKDTLKAMGYKFEEHDQPQNLKGYQDDIRDQKAHIIVRKDQLTSAFNDLGFVKTADGKVKMIISAYDRRVKKVKEDFMERLNKEYGIAKLKKQCQRMGMQITQQQQMKDGRVKIKVRALA